MTKMMGNNILAPSILVILLFCESAVGARTKLLSANNGQDATSALAPSANDGICATMVETHGYACEEHTVTTQDGYILSMQRIPVRKSGEASGNRIPVLLQHGLLMDGITWLLLPPDQSLAFLLADNGYEVWLGNTRGTKYSLGHTSLSPDDPGTLVALGAFCKDQQLNRLRSAVLLSPIAYVGQIPSPLARAAAENFIAEALYKADIREFNPKGKALVEVLKAVCSKPGVDCTHLLTAFTVIRDGTVAMFDYNNKDENMQHYGQPNPPVYSMTSIPNDLPLFLSYGGADALSDVKDVKLLLASLKDHDGDKLVVQYRDDYAHADFVMGQTANKDVYDPLMAFLKLQ
ncbi:hypothetical protein ACE6H2_011662 [Prunus campanulata]